MKKKLLLLCCLCSLSLFAKEIDFAAAAKEKTPINFAYRTEQDTYRIYVKPLHQTVITFGTDEIEYAETGDNVSFHTIADKHSIRVKVMDENLLTDLVVKTNRGFYYFKVYSTYGAYNPMINFLYPQEEMLKTQKLRKESEPMSLNIEEMNNAYTLSKKYAWTPTQIMDDGKKTIFFMPYKLQEMPAFLIKTGDKSDPYAVAALRVKEVDGEKGIRLLILDRVFEEGVFQLGDKKVVVKNKRYRY